jgi:internalin A
MTNDKLLRIIQEAAENGSTELSLSSKKLTSLPAGIGRLTNLRSLSLSSNQLTSLPTEIVQLTNLRSLYLSNNQLTSLPAEIVQLTNLRSFSLSGNQLTSLPAEILQLTNLRSLSVHNNQLMKLPAEIGQLTNLQTLSLSYNRLTSLPAEIGQLTNLQTLSVHNNQLMKLPAEIGQLTNLQTLSFSYNQLTSVPAEIGQLTNLQTLSLSYNQLTSLSAEIGQLVNLQTLKLSNNANLSLPPEIRGKKARDVIRFYRQQLEQDIDRLYEAKLLIIGEGGAGKTTLAQKIQDPDYTLQDDERSTDGIEIIQYRFALDNDNEFRVNIWDFGGQQIYHETHQFFLTKRSLYILVADARKEDTDFFYWLNVVELLSDNSPLLIVKNEKQNIKLAINERQLRGKFTNLKDTFAANFADNRGLPDILAALKHHISSLPHVGTELPKSWVKVRQALEAHPSNHISLEEYLKICQDNGFTRLDDKLQLSSYLHDLGVCLHFQDDDLLSKTVILKPTWGTDAVYKVLRNPHVTQNLGKFTRADLASIWHEEKYATMRPELLRLMMNFKLCYEIPNQRETYTAPQLLSPEQPEYTWDESANLLLRYEYEFMPKGILTRFIVEMHRWIEAQTCVWKTGVVLNKENARVEVIELYRYHKGEIQIRVSGKRKRDLLTTVRHELDKIHASYENRLKYSTKVPCNCTACKDSQTPYFFTLERLHEFLDKGRQTIQCYDSGDDVIVQSLIDDINVTRSHLSTSQRTRSSNLVIYEKNAPKVFISYSWDSDTHRQQVLSFANTLRHKWGIDVEIDAYVRAEPPYTPEQGWDLWMQENIESAEFVLMVCTETYKRRFEGKEKPGKGLGASWEGTIIRQDLYQAQSRSTKFIPVVFSHDDSPHIPTILRSKGTYTLRDKESYTDLCYRLKKQSRVHKPELGNPDFDLPPEPEYFSPDP